MFPAAVNGRNRAGQCKLVIGVLPNLIFVPVERIPSVTETIAAIIGQSEVEPNPNQKEGVANVTSDSRDRQKSPVKRSLQVDNEHFAAAFDTARLSAVVLQHPRNPRL